MELTFLNFGTKVQIYIQLEKNFFNFFVLKKITTSMLYFKYQEYYYILLVFNSKFYYICNQKVEEEIGSAGEQPTSNKLSALYSKRKGDGI